MDYFFRNLAHVTVLIGGLLLIEAFKNFTKDLK